VTGGIASGKSAICKRLEKLGAATVDCDKLGNLLVYRVKLGNLLVYRVKLGNLLTYRVEAVTHCMTINIKVLQLITGSFVS
jgi:hypothetical protein